MLLYRIEDEDGDGPYQRSNKRGKRPVSHIIHPDGYDSERHPGITSFLGIDQHFAFRYMRDLRRWFNERERVALHELDFMIAHYRCPAKYVDVQTRQVIFWRNHAKLIKRVGIIKNPAEPGLYNKKPG